MASGREVAGVSDSAVRIDERLAARVVELRRWFHRHPEPSFEERATQAKVLEVLGGLGIECRPAGGTGVVADIRGRQERPRIALRSDMDALRIQEAATGLNRDYRSENDGVMHACGHDAHMAMLLGVAEWLQQRRETLGGSVRLVFQPAEEVPPGGAERMIGDGCLDGVDGIVALHVFGNLPSGRLAFRCGPFMASSRTFELTIRGKPGHHMCPEDNIDPIVIAARFVDTIQTDLRRALSPNARYVLGFGEVHAGMQHNQTPAEATVVGTFRAYELRDSERILGQLRASLDGLMRTFARAGVEGLPAYELAAEPAYPPLVNTPAFTRHAAGVLRAAFADVDDEMEPNLGAEDFARYVERVPGMFIFLGGGNPARGITAMNHHDRFDIDEPALSVGVRALLVLATDFLAGPDVFLGPR
jgi:amidohydrolase